MSRTDLLHSLLAQRILILDGAMGTMIQRYKLGEADYRGERFADFAHDLKGNNDLLCLTQPQIIRHIHAEYLDAGRRHPRDQHLQRHLDFHGGLPHGTPGARAQRGRRPAGARGRRRSDAQNPAKPRFVAGVLGPTTRTATISPDVNDPGFRNVTFDQLRDGLPRSHRRPGRWRRRHPDGRNHLRHAERQGGAVRHRGVLRRINMRLPVMISGTITDASGRTLSGQTAEAFWNSVRHARPLSIGLNCALGADVLRQYVEELSSKADVFISAHPNAGLPNAFGEYDRTAPKWPRTSANGHARGCSTSSAAAAAPRRRTSRPSPRRSKASRRACRPELEPAMRLSGLEPFNIGKDSLFVNVGERTNVTGSQSFCPPDPRRPTTTRRWRSPASRWKTAPRSSTSTWTRPCSTPRRRWCASSPDRLRAGHRARADHDRLLEVERHRGRPEVRAGQGHRQLDLDEGRRSRVHRARQAVPPLRRGGGRDGLRRSRPGRHLRAQDRNLRPRLQAADRSVGFPPEDIIFDPNIFAIATGIEEHNNYAVDFIEATRWIRQNLPYAQISGGVSNVSFSFRGNDPVREAIHTVFLYHAIQAGMDMGIVNAGQLGVYENLDPELRERVEDVLLNRREDATERLVKFAENVKGGAKERVEDLAWRKPAGERAPHAMRWCRASPHTSSRTPKKRAWKPRARCT